MLDVCIVSIIRMIRWSAEDGESCTTIHCNTFNEILMSEFFCALSSIIICANVLNDEVGIITVHNVFHTYSDEKNTI